MIAGVINLKNYNNWRVYYYMLTSAKDASIILDRLHNIGCSVRFLRKARRLLYSARLNKGLAYSNKYLRRSIVVISEATDAGEFLNSFAHEIDHLEKHIAKALNFSPYSEQASYLVGEIVREMFYNIKAKLK